jgi:hypothetical protein
LREVEHGSLGIRAVDGQARDLVAAMVTLGTPTISTLPAFAARAVRWRDGSVLDVAVASPNSTSARASPIRSLLAPLTPAKALMFLPAIVREIDIVNRVVSICEYELILGFLYGRRAAEADKPEQVYIERSCCSEYWSTWSQHSRS